VPELRFIFKNYEKIMKLDNLFGGSFFFNNHREYIKKIIKLITKAKYKDITKKEEEKKNKLRKKLI
jgi:hypothetical protein